MEWNRNNVLKGLLVIFLLLGLAISGQFQEVGSGLNKDKWEKETEGIDYGDIKPEEKKAGEINEPTQIEPKENVKWIDIPIVKAIVFGLIILLLLFILYKIFGSMVFGEKVVRKDQKDFTLEDIEENLEEADIDFHLSKAVDESDFRKAIRLYYLSIIKELTYRNWIDWKKDKTNSHYLREMRSKEQYNEFRDLTTAFEIVWYGEAEIKEHHFRQLKPIFTGFLNRIENLTL